MPTKDDILSWRGQDLHGTDGEKLGKIEEIYLDTETREPEWALVTTGLFGTKQSFVPLRDASGSSDGVTVPFEKSTVKDAPTVDPDGQLSQDEEAALYQHYGLDYSQSESGSGLPEGGTTGTSGVAGTGGTTSGAGYGSGRDDVRDDARGDDASDDARGGTTGTSGTTGYDTSGPTTDDAMTRSEEELSVGTTRREAGRARLQKYVVEEEVTQTVPVRREEVRVEREPITDANVGDATDGPEISEEEHEVVLHEEEPVAEKRTVPKERVRLDTDVQTDERQVSDTVRKEQIDVDGDSR
jgi:uncharacterized protein (TIGR02271 family)